jgi:hypothetical protein
MALTPLRLVRPEGRSGDVHYRQLQKRNALSNTRSAVGIAGIASVENFVQMSLSHESRTIFFNNLTNLPYARSSL